MLIFTFFLFSSSRLLPNENPYTILGVSKYASMDEIKKAYRKLVFACHPDRHKDEESYHKFIKVSEAYEILSDQEKKMQFDRDGRIKEKSVHREDNDYSRNIQVPLINQHIFPSLAKNGEEWIILVTQHFDCPNCARQSQVFDEFAKEAGQYVKVGKLDATSSPDLVEQLGAKSFPAYFSVRYDNGTVKSRKFATIFDNKDQAIQHLFAFWKSSVKYLNSQANLDSWLEIDSSKTHVLEILSSSNSKTSIHFRYAASKIGGYALFSSITESTELILKYNIKKTPCVLIFRGHKTNPIQIDTKGRHILDDIEEFCTPLFSYVNSANYKQICQPWCVVATSLPNRTYIDSISDYPFNLALIHSSFAKSLSLTSGWAVISDEKYMKVEVSSPDDLISVCSRLYRNDGLKDEGEEIKHSVFLGFVDSIMSIFSGFEINNGKIVLTILQIAIPIPLVIAVGVLISVFLFICGLYDHTISNEQKIAKVKKNTDNKQTKKEVTKDQNKEETKVEKKEAKESVEKKEEVNKNEKKSDDKHEKR